MFLSIRRYGIDRVSDTGSYAEISRRIGCCITFKKCDEEMGMELLRSSIWKVDNILEIIGFLNWS
jgi:hypothetical protein